MHSENHRFPSLFWTVTPVSITYLFLVFYFSEKLVGKSIPNMLHYMYAERTDCMGKKFLNIQSTSPNAAGIVKQDLKFKTGDFLWKVKFNIPLDPNTVNANNMYVANSSNIPLKTSIRYDSVTNQIEIEPAEPYSTTESYYLHITTNVASRNGQRLKEPVQVQFQFY